MKKLINWLKKTPVFENLKKRVFLTRVRLFPKYRKKILKKAEIEMEILTKGKIEIIGYIKKRLEKSKYESLIIKLIEILINSNFYHNSINMDFINVSESEISKIKESEKLEFIQELKANLVIANSRWESFLLKEKKKLSFYLNFWYSDSQNYKDHVFMQWIQSSIYKFSIPNYEDFNNYRLIQEIFQASNFNNVIFIIKSTFQKVKNKNEYKIWIKAELEKSIKLFKKYNTKENNFVSGIEKTEEINRLEFALKTINELDITENNTIKENHFVEKWTNFNNQNISITEHNKTEPPINKQNKNPHPRIFVDAIHFDFFTHLQTTVKNELADYSFIFRRMQTDGYIFESIKESEFREWLSKEYEITIDKLKLLDYCKTKQKEIIYTTAKHIFKLN